MTEKCNASRDCADTMHIAELNYWHVDTCESQAIAIKLSVFCKLGSENQTVWIKHFCIGRVRCILE